MRSRAGRPASPASPLAVAPSGTELRCRAPSGLAASRLFAQLHAEHRLQRRVILRRSPCPSGRGTIALQRRDHLFEIVVFAFCSACTSIRAGAKPSGVKRSGHLAFRASLHEPVVRPRSSAPCRRSARGMDLRRRPAPSATRSRAPRVRSRRRSRRRRPAASARHIAPAVVPAHATKTRSAFSVLDLLRERREVGRGKRYRDLGPPRALRAHERPDGRESCRGRRPSPGRARRPCGRRASRNEFTVSDVLLGLAARAERVLVDPGDRVGSGRPGDEEHLVLRGERATCSATPDETVPTRIL